MPMFDIEDSSDVTLEGNKTSKETLAKIKNVDRLNAKNNEAAVEKEKPKADENILALKPSYMGIGIDLRALWRKYFKKVT